MIAYLRNEEIDRRRWDDSLAEIPGLRPYPWSWYLDIMAPGWEALVDDDYLSLFPLPCSRKFGFNYIATPLFLQQLGLFTADGDSNRIATEFVSFMPEFYRLIDLNVGQEIRLPGFIITRRDNFELKLDRPYEEIWLNYSTDCRRNINIAHRYPQDIVGDVKPQEVIALFRSNIGKRAGVIRETSYKRLQALMDHCLETGKGSILGVRSPKGKLLWGVFCIYYRSRITMLFTAGSRKSRELRTAYHVIDNIIRMDAESNMTLDFAGSSVPSIALFMKSFGGTKTIYYRLYRNTLPWPVRLLK
ncbi:MAG: hypothetical protein P1P83_11635 [Bacteroidales bacterium]|nr:hypothetical protein [Bacteroidales bacterium]MDT8374863.1 hypothetical protein [Bacteroidales bacterium]